MINGCSKVCRLTKIFLSLALLALPLVARGQFNYATNDDTITITKYTGTDSEVIIPESVNGLLVTRIGDNAFAFNRVVAAVAIPNTVTSIGASAFGFCQMLTEIKIPGSVVTIGDWAFHSCTGLTNAILSDGVTTIGNGMFYYCTRLASVNIPYGVVSIGSEAFAGAPIPTVLIPDTVLSLGRGAFKGCAWLSAVVLPNGITSIPSDIFGDCSHLTAVTLGKAVTEIGSYAFYFCSRLKTLTIPKTVTILGVSAFESCSQLKSIYFEGDSPSADSSAFTGDIATVYYKSGTTGWKPTFAGLPTVLWNPKMPFGDAQFGIVGDHFGFAIKSTGQLNVVVEMCSDLLHPNWLPVATKTVGGASSYFSDAQWKNQSARFYRLRSP